MNSCPLEAGEVLAGKYKVERVLGAGGMGVVVAATHLQLDQRVALKFLLPEVLDNADVVARFAREARAAAKIQSEHVARVIDVGTLPTGSPYMVMEYLEGHDLATELEQRGPLPVVEAVTHILEACEALAEAHAAGIVHRDLKPANLFLARQADRSTIVKVLDFGISKHTTGADAGITKTSTLIGSPFYMSPEQLTNVRAVDSRSDIWALGIILYELLMGRQPFFAETMPEIIAMILGTPPPPMRASRADLRPEIEEVVMRCLQRGQGDRYANVADLARALAPWGSQSAAQSVDRISRVLGSSELPAVRAPMVSVHSDAIPGAATLAATDTAWHNEGPAPPPKSRKLPLMLGVAAFGLMAGVAAVVVASARTTVVPSASASSLAAVPASSPAAAVVAPPPPPVAPAPAAMALAPLGGSEVAAAPDTTAQPQHAPAATPASPSRSKPSTKRVPAAAAAAPAPPPAAAAPEPAKKNPLQIDLK